MPRRPIHPFSPLAALTIVCAGCGGDAPATPASTYTLQLLAGEPSLPTLRERMTAAATTIVVANGDAAMHRVAEAALALAAKVPVIGIARSDNTRALDDGTAAVLVAPAHMATVNAAIELTLLACSGIAPPPSITIGAAWLSPANRAAGGQTQPSPSEFALATMRMQHGDVLSQTPTTDVVFRVGIVADTAHEPSQLRAAAIAAAATGWPQLEVHRSDDPSAFVASNFNALLAVGDLAPEAAAHCHAARERGIKVIGVGTNLAATDMVAHISLDADAIGRATAEAIATLAPAGAQVLLLGFDANDARDEACRTSLAAALAARQPK